MKKSYSAPEESYLVNFDEKKNPSSTNLSRTTKTSKNTNFKSFSLTLNLAKRSYQQYYVNFCRLPILDCLELKDYVSLIDLTRNKTAIVEKM